MYANTAALPRPELSVFLEEAQGAEKNLIAEKVLPVYTSDERVGRYPRLRIEKGELLKREATLRAPRGSYNEVNRQFEWDTFECTERGLEEMVDDVHASEMKNFFSVEQITAKLIRRMLMIDHEVRVAQTIMDPNMFNSKVAVAPYKESTLEDIDFAKDIQDAQERMLKKGVVPNTMILSLPLWNLLRRSKKFQTFCFGNLPSGHQRLVETKDVSSIFNISTIHVAAQHYDSGTKNVNNTINLEPIWGNSYIALVDVQSGDFENGGVGRTIVWSADCPGGLYCSESYRCERRRGDMLRVRMNTSEKVISDIACELVTTGWESE